MGSINQLIHIVGFLDQIGGFWWTHTTGRAVQASHMAEAADVDPLFGHPVVWPRCFPSAWTRWISRHRFVEIFAWGPPEVPPLTMPSSQCGLGPSSLDTGPRPNRNDEELPGMRKARHEFLYEGASPWQSPAICTTCLSTCKHPSSNTSTPPQHQGMDSLPSPEIGNALQRRTQESNS